MATAVQYPQQWIPIENDCSDCRMRYKLEVEFIAGPSALQLYQHCPNDDGKHIPGRLLAVWELQDGKWRLNENYT